MTHGPIQRGRGRHVDIPSARIALEASISQPIRLYSGRGVKLKGCNYVRLRFLPFLVVFTLWVCRLSGLIVLVVLGCIRRRRRRLERPMLFQYFRLSAPPCRHFGVIIRCGFDEILMHPRSCWWILVAVEFQEVFAGAPMDCRWMFAGSDGIKMSSK